MDGQAVVECLNEARFPPLVRPKTSALEDCANEVVDRCLNVQESLRPSMKDVYEAILAWPLDASKAEAEDARDRKQGPSSSWTVRYRDEPLRVEQGAGVDAQEPVAIRPPSSSQQFAISNFTMPTSSTARLVTLLRTVATWNYEVCSQACCKLHAGAFAVRQSFLELEQFSCSNILLPEHSLLQC